MFSPAFIFAALGLTLLYGMWRWRHSPLVSPRAIALAAVPSAFFLAFGIPPLLYAAGGGAYSDNGMTVLLVLDGFGGLAMVFEALISHKFHPVMTTFFCALFGFCVAVTVADWPQVTTFVKRLPHRAGRSMGKESHHIQSVGAAHGQAAHSQHVLLVVVAIVVVVVVLIARGRHNSSVRDGGQGQPALPAPVLHRELGIGRFIRGFLAGRRNKRGFGPGGTGGIPAGLPRPAGGGRRNQGGPAAVPSGADGPAWADPAVRN